MSSRKGTSTCAPNFRRCPLGAFFDRLVLCSSADLVLRRAVLETLEPLAGDRKCFRMINGVLVEVTVKDVLPPLKTNTDGLKQVGKELEAQLLSKQKELDEWKVSHEPLEEIVLATWTCLTKVPAYRRRTMCKLCNRQTSLLFEASISSNDSAQSGHSARNIKMILQSGRSLSHYITTRNW